MHTHPHTAGGLRRLTMKGVAMGSAPSRNFGHFLTFCAEFVGFVVLMAGLLSATILAFALGAH